MALSGGGAGLRCLGMPSPPTHFGCVGPSCHFLTGCAANAPEVANAPVQHASHEMDNAAKIVDGKACTKFINSTHACTY